MASLASSSIQQVFKEEIIPSLYKLFQKVEKEGTPPTFFYEVRITRIQKYDRDCKKRKLQKNNPYRQGRKILNKALTNQILEKGQYTLAQWGLSQECKVGSASTN